MRIFAPLTALALPLVLWAVLPTKSSGQSSKAEKLSDLQQRIDRARGTCIQHAATMSSCYAHQSRFGTSLGAGVKQAQVIGYVENTSYSLGARLHFEVRINGTPVDPVGYL